MKEGWLDTPGLGVSEAPQRPLSLLSHSSPLHPEVFWEDEEEEGDNGDNLS